MCITVLYCSESDVKINNRREGGREDQTWHLETVWAAVTLGMSPGGAAARRQSDATSCWGYAQSQAAA